MPKLNYNPREVKQWLRERGFTPRGRASNGTASNWSPWNHQHLACGYKKRNRKVDASYPCFWVAIREYDANTWVGPTYRMDTFEEFKAAVVTGLLTNTLEGCGTPDRKRDDDKV